MFKRENLIFKLVSVDTLATSTILIGKVTTLAHKLWDNTMEWTALVAETFLAGAQRSEIFSGFWYDLLKKIPFFF